MKCRLPLWMFGLVTLGSIVVGCSVVRSGTQQTKEVISTLSGGKLDNNSAQQMQLLQTAVMRLADQYVAVVADASDKLAARLGTREARAMAQHWKLQQAEGAYITATGQNPYLNVMDMVVLATVSRMIVEDYWVREKYGRAAEPLLEAQRQIETNAWGVAHQALTRELRDELRDLIEQWRAANPAERNVGAARFSSLVKFMRSTPGGTHEPGLASLFSLAAVNPLSGLDPAVREVEQTRQFAARAMYYLERAPRLWSWQAELLTYQLADQPETRQVLSNVNEVATSTRSFARTAEDLPALVKEEREAAINQLLAGVANERSNILATLNAQEAQLRELLPQVRKTFAAGGEMASSVEGAIKSLDAFVHYVSPPVTNPAPADTNSAPFNVLDYGTAATQIGAMARDLTGLLNSVDKSVPELTRLSDQAAGRLERVVHRAFWLALVLILVLVVGSLLAALWYRALSRSARAPARAPVETP